MDASTTISAADAEVLGRAVFEMAFRVQAMDQFTPNNRGVYEMKINGEASTVSVAQGTQKKMQEKG